MRQPQIQPVSFVPRPATRADITDTRLFEGSRLSFWCLVGFIATQCYLIPIMALPTNWALWPSLPDIFGVLLVFSVVMNKDRPPKDPEHQKYWNDLFWMWIGFAANFLLVTIPSSITGDGIRFGGFTVLLLAKYLVVYWAVSRVPLNLRRIQILHVAAIFALVFLCFVTVADRLSLIEVNDLVSHLPAGASGRWSAYEVNSTVSSTHGGTSVVILILSALILGTIRHPFGWAVNLVVYVLSVSAVFLNGSRQGLVRITTFVGLHVLSKPFTFYVGVLALLIGIWLLTLDPGLLFQEIEEESLRNTLLRQQVLITDPFSSEGLSGRPELWDSVITTLNDQPLRWLVGYGIGNYAEFDNAAHHMILQYLQDGGLIFLFFNVFLWTRIFGRIWRDRRRIWPIVSLTAAMLTSIFTSGIFYPNLATGWYLGLYFVTIYLVSNAKDAA